MLVKIVLYLCVHLFMAMGSDVHQGGLHASNSAQIPKDVPVSALEEIRDKSHEGGYNKPHIEATTTPPGIFHHISRRPFSPGNGRPTPYPGSQRDVHPGTQQGTSSGHPGFINRPSYLQMVYDRIRGMVPMVYDVANDKLMSYDKHENDGYIGYPYVTGYGLEVPPRVQRDSNYNTKLKPSYPSPAPYFPGPGQYGSMPYPSHQSLGYQYYSGPQYHGPTVPPADSHHYRIHDIAFSPVYYRYNDNSYFPGYIGLCNRYHCPL